MKNVQRTLTNNCAKYLYKYKMLCGGSSIVAQYNKMFKQFIILFIQQIKQLRENSPILRMRSEIKKKLNNKDININFTCKVYMLLNSMLMFFP